MSKFITEEDLVILKEILAYKKVTKEQVFIIQSFIRRYIDNRANICNHCSSQIRFAHQRIVKWNEKYQDEFIIIDDEEE